jgi:hypothetical protein
MSDEEIRAIPPEVIREWLIMRGGEIKTWQKLQEILELTIEN